MAVTHKRFKILSGHNIANRRTDRQTDRQTDERSDGRKDGRADGPHTIIRPKFHFGRIKTDL